MHWLKGSLYGSTIMIVLYTNILSVNNSEILRVELFT